MNRNRLLNAQLSHAIASMGHGDLMIICDAGFPIPSTTWRIDLAITPDVPDLETVLAPIAANFIAEKVSFAEEIKVHNKPLLMSPPPLANMSDPWLQLTFDGAQAKSRELSRHYAALAGFFKVDFLDAGTVITTGGVDGIHLTSENNADLGKAVARKVQAMFGH